MKKILSVLLCMLLIFCFAACRDDKETGNGEYTYEIGFLTAFTDVSIDDEDKVEAAWNGVRRFAEDQGKTYKYYEAEAGNTKSQLASVEDAVDEGVKVIVAAGPEVKEAIAKAQTEYQDVTFIYLDGKLDKIEDNCVVVDFDSLEAGFLAGYSAVIEGLDNLGYLANGESEEAVSYGYGFLQGCNEASMRFNRFATIRYDYGSKDAAEEDVAKIVKTWYENGTEAVFTYGGDTYATVKDVAEDLGKTVIASNGSKEYSKTVITSARKHYEEAVAEHLQAFYDGTFKGGKSIHMDAKNDGVGLDMKNSKFQYFTQDMYHDIYKEMEKGDLKLLSQKDAKTLENLIKDKWLYYIRIEEQ